MVKTFITILFCLVLFNNAFTQHKIRKSDHNHHASLAEDEVYDSLHHSLRPEDWGQYVGQTFYILPLKSRRAYGYEGFYQSPEIDHKNHYYDNGLGGTIDSVLVGKYLDVIGVKEVNSPHGKHKDIFLELQERESGDKLFYSSLHISSSQILVLGYLEKQKIRYLGRSFHVNLSDEVNGETELVDINTGEKFIVTNGQQDEVIDISIYEFPRYYNIGYFMKTYDNHEYVLYWNEFSDYLR